MANTVEEDVREIKTSVAVIATKVENLGQTLGEIKIERGELMDKETVRLWFKEHVLNCIDRKAERESSPPASPGIWASLSEKQRTALISAAVGLFTTGSTILAIKFGG